MRHIFCILCVLCVMVTSATAQNISRIEYFFNTDPGYGNATELTGYTPSANIVSFPASINLSLVPLGANNLYVRAKDGSGNWSITNIIPFFKVEVNAFNIVYAEYFFNTDPGFGKATPITGFTQSADIAKFPVSINLSAVPYGVNILYIRVKDSNGNWSTTNAIPIVKVDVSTHNIVRAEYFFNTDPGFGKGTAVVLSVSDNLNKQVLTLNLESVPLGINTLYLRAEDNIGNWSLTNCLTFIKGTVEGNISALEYYIDIDPGLGLATSVSLVPGQNISNYIFNANVSSYTDYTTHNLFMRVKDTDGAWSLTNIVSFTKMPGVGIDEYTDASAAFKVFPNPATDKITVQCLPTQQMDKIELIDIHGELIQVKSSGNNTEKQADISRLSKGAYFIKITLGKDVVYKKIVKE